MNIFIIQKLIFDQFLKLQIMDFGQKKILREIDLFDGSSFDP